MILSIRYKLILSICVPLLVGMVVLLSFDYSTGKAQVAQKLQVLMAQRAVESAAQIDARLETVMAGTEAAAMSVARLANATGGPLAAAREQPIERALQAQTRLMGSSYGAAWFVEKPGEEPGGLFFRRGQPVPRPMSEMLPRFGGVPDWYTKVKQSEHGQWSDLFTIEGNKAQHLVAYIVPIIDDGVFKGAVATLLNAEGIQGILTGFDIDRRNAAATRAAAEVTDAGPVRPRDRLRERITQRATDAPEPAADLISRPSTLSSEWSLVSKFGPEGFVVLDRSLMHVSHPDPSRIGTRRGTNDTSAIAPDESDRFRGQLLGAEPGVLVLRGDTRNAAGLGTTDDYWVAHAPIAATGWVFVTWVPERLVVSEVVAELQLRAVVFGCAITVLTLIVAAISMRLSRPVERLAGAMGQLASGDLSVRVGAVGGAREFEQLARGFDDMASSLGHNIEKLAEQTAQREAIEAELRVAREIQSELLPRKFPPFPDRHEFTLHAVNAPARRVAGDFYDFFFCGDVLTIVIADVSGKGVPASLLMAVTRTLIRNFAKAGLSPREIMSRCNSVLLEDAAQGMFVTMFLCQFNPRTGHVAYVNAGHPHPLRVTARGEVSRFGQTTGGIVGIVSEEELGHFAQEEERLEAGEMIVMYTDGVSEAMDASGSMFGEGRLEARLQTSAARSVDRICTDLVEALDAHEGPQHADDITAVVLKRRG
jgi:sigma-B regulation protein RsbU (phosphoserine phosphatase)